MAGVGLFDKQAEVYLSVRPKYPSDWFSRLSALTPHHSLAWDAGTGNGQAAMGVAEFYDQVIATDVSEPQISLSMPHPKVKYVHTPPSMSDDELIAMFGGEGMVDLGTVATAVHCVELQAFYYRQCPSFLELAMRRFLESTAPYRNPGTSFVRDEYKTLPFPFESVGSLGSEGEPLMLEMKQEASFEVCLGVIKSWSLISTAKEKGVDLLNEGVVKELETAWGGTEVIRTLNYNAFMLVGKVPN
ncbi:hypothetical protein Sjap_018351 [Stephania japonica]|uniref:S-adenosyl-L-methionine-dependent methyltransferase n=1 Tax=Stephania japonica TaxID=461633 RepID=A0AAP0NN27_9MAGN